MTAQMHTAAQCFCCSTLNVFSLSSTGIGNELFKVISWCSLCLQLLDYGADVHNPGLIIRQAPLRVAVCDLNMDSEMVELLVSRGASPFLEDVDGQYSIFIMKQALCLNSSGST